MLIFKKPDKISSYLRYLKCRNETIGFVPTMGALHQGHLALIRQALEGNSITVCSIFINPRQFNRRDDYTGYPATPVADMEKLESAGCDVLFLPSEEDIYPPGNISLHYDLGYLEQILEGRYRPGHFQGVCQVVDRLLGIVEPDSLYLGQKDLQQCLVIKKLLELTGRKDHPALFIVPTLRDADGLALSSRNMRLNPDQRQLAPAIYHELVMIRGNLGNTSFTGLENTARRNLMSKGFMVDYLQIVNARTLEPAEHNGEPLVAVAAASLGEIRLIDNLPLN